MLVSIWSWERLWVPEHTGDLPRMHHTVCGEDFVPRVTCRSCRRARQRERRCRAVGAERLVGAVGAGARRDDDRSTSQAGLFPQTMTVLGNRWAFAILVAAFVGISRFTDFQTQLAAPPGSVADRLSIFAAERGAGRRRITATD